MLPQSARLTYPGLPDLKSVTKFCSQNQLMGRKQLPAGCFNEKNLGK